MKGTVLIFICCIFFLESCDKEKRQGVNCTANFASIEVIIKNGLNIPVALDSFKVVRSIDSKNVTVEFTTRDFEIMHMLGSYPITNDGYKVQLSNKRMEVVFIGSKGGKTIVNEKYTIGADQCHVRLIAGNREVIVE